MVKPRVLRSEPSGPSEELMNHTYMLGRRAFLRAAATTGAAALVGLRAGRAAAARDDDAEAPAVPQRLSGTGSRGRRAPPRRRVHRRPIRADRQQSRYGGSDGADRR